MKLAIISDIHGNLEALRTVLADIAARPVDRILCLGDIVGYNADPVECLTLVRNAGAICIAGNHDRAVAGLCTAEGWNSSARRAVEWTQRQLDSDALAYLAGLPLDAALPGLLVAVHGTLLASGGCDTTYLDSDARRLECLGNLSAHPAQASICAFGHTHRLEATALRDGHLSPLAGDRLRLANDAAHLLNPGTVGQPRTTDRRATYLILDSESRDLTIRRLDYDFAIPLAKTRAAGLVPGAAESALKAGARLLGLAGVAGATRRLYRRARTGAPH